MKWYYNLQPKEEFFCLPVWHWHWFPQPKQCVFVLSELDQREKMNYRIWHAVPHEKYLGTYYSLDKNVFLPSFLYQDKSQVVCFNMKEHLIWPAQNIARQTLLGTAYFISFLALFLTVIEEKTFWVVFWHKSVVNLYFSTCDSIQCLCFCNSLRPMGFISGRSLWSLLAGGHETWAILNLHGY